MNTLRDKVILITGAGRGQGRSHALTAAREGASLILADAPGPIPGIRYELASEADLKDTVAAVEDLDAKVVSASVDVRDPDAIDALVAAGVAEFGKIDGVVANAGLWDLGPTVWETSEEAWAVVLDVCLSGAWRTIKATAPHLIANGQGSIVIISSINAIEPTAGYTSYVVAKHGLLGLMRNTALELAPYNVRCNSVAPGAIDTRIWNNPMGYELFGAAGDDARSVAIDSCYAYPALAGRSALPAQATSNAVVWLLSDLTEHITGITLPVDAGHLIQPGWNANPAKAGTLADRYRPPRDAPL